MEMGSGTLFAPPVWSRHREISFTHPELSPSEKQAKAVLVGAEHSEGPPLAGPSCWRDREQGKKHRATGPEAYAPFPVFAPIFGTLWPGLTSQVLFPNKNCRKECLRGQDALKSCCVLSTP